MAVSMAITGRYIYLWVILFSRWGVLYSNLVRAGRSDTANWG